MSSSKQIAVAFQDVSYQVKEKTLLSQLNLAIEQGEALVLLGRSGSGKTTTLKLVNNLLTPTAGTVTVEGKKTTEWKEIRLRRNIGYVIQEIGLFPHFSVAKNVGLVPSLLGWKANEVRSRVYELLHLVGLEPEQFAQRYPDSLSGGQKQRVGIARALAADPPILLMDEPFGALDPITRLELQQQFQHLQEQLGKTVIFVTHDIQEAFFLATRIGLMSAGKLVELAKPKEFVKSEHPEAKRFLACLDTFKSFEQMN
ncbi:MAG: ATP-binding cassette domain-containing protein [Xenococcaceae cyanobacterium MO_188.B29]|nr:ATP-binding cassette domain-containing protein [Xenococcaceae cyanobacterium MO_188.B29]